MSRTTGCLLAVCAWTAIAGFGSPARAQDADAPEEFAPADPANVAPDREDLGVNIEQWVFGGQADEGRKKIEAALRRELGRFDRRYGLTPGQKKKLELAGRHDMKQFFDRVEGVKQQYREARGDFNKVMQPVLELQSIQNQPHVEIFGDKSMLAKTLRKTVTPEQIAAYEKSVYRERVEWMVGVLHSRLVLNVDQRKGLATLIVEETPPLKRYGSFDYDAIMFQMSRLPREKLRTVLQESQVRELALRFDQARRMEGILVSEGYLRASKQAPASAAGKPSASSGPEGVKAALGRP